MDAEYSMHGGNEKCTMMYKWKDNMKMDLREIVCEDRLDSTTSGNGAIVGNSQVRNTVRQFTKNAKHCI
jgi:hypothetical protein